MIDGVPNPGSKEARELGCDTCDGVAMAKKRLAPNSLAALKIALAEAGLAHRAVEDEMEAPYPGADYRPTQRAVDAWRRFIDAEEAVIAHPYYEEA